MAGVENGAVPEPGSGGRLRVHRHPRAHRQPLDQRPRVRLRHLHRGTDTHARATYNSSKCVHCLE